jgi:RHS repeat-associated protein
MTMKKKLSKVWLLLALWLVAAAAHAGTHHYYYTDPQGTVLAKADASGTIIATYDYAPYGTAVASMSPAPNGPGYTGHVNDPDTGLVYMQARYYDPAVGRFLSVDPAGVSMGNLFNFNRFAYVNNNPIANIDPDGTTCTRSDSSKSYVCQVDKNDAKFTDEQIKTVNKDYTNTVNTLNSHPNKTVTVTMQGISFKATAGEVARGLIDAKVVTRAKSSARASTYGGGIGAISDYHLTYQPEIRIFLNAVTSDRSGGKSNIDSDLSRTFAHEGIHTQPRERVFFDISRANPAKFNIDHMKEYNRAGDALYKGDK